MQIGLIRFKLKRADPFECFSSNIKMNLVESSVSIWHASCGRSFHRGSNTLRKAVQTSWGLLRTPVHGSCIASLEAEHPWGRIRSARNSSRRTVQPLTWKGPAVPGEERAFRFLFLPSRLSEPFLPLWGVGYADDLPAPPRVPRASVLHARARTGKEAIRIS